MLTDERCKQLMTDLGMPNSQFLYSALQQVANEVEQATRAEVRAEAQGPVALPIPPAGIIAHPNLGELYDCLQMQQFAMKYAMLHAAPQPPAPCPKCAENVQDAIDWMKRALKTEGERDALQAKVAEQSAEIGRLTKERDEYNSAWQRSGVEYRKLRDSLLSLAGEFK